MVTLRIWHPTRLRAHGRGSSAITVDGVWGAAHMSTRPLEGGLANPHRKESPNTTLTEDIAAEGADTGHIWRFSHMDEGRMLRLWVTLRDAIALVSRAKYEDATGFKTSDLILAAGRGRDVETYPVATATARAEAMIFTQTAAANSRQLQARADHYAQVEHW
jgi:hypothetical protein